jgi:hypothetical protein
VANYGSEKGVRAMSNRTEIQNKYRLIELLKVNACYELLFMMDGKSEAQKQAFKEGIRTQIKSEELMLEALKEPK